MTIPETVKTKMQMVQGGEDKTRTVVDEPYADKKILPLKRAAKAASAAATATMAIREG